MKCAKYALFISWLVLFVPTAFCQESLMFLNNQESGSRQRNLVIFNHEQHADKLECGRCHHNYDAYINNRGGEDKAQPCANCHKPISKKRMPSLTEAFHLQCKNCHTQTRARAKASGPVMCAGCHLKS